MPKRKKKTPKKQVALNDRQKEFVRHYVAGENGVRGNGTQAAIAAGYAKKGADVQAVRLLGNARIKAAIEERQKRLEEKADVDAARVLREYARIAFGDPRAIATWGPDGVKLKDSTKLTDEEATLIASVQETQHGVGFKLNSKLGALDALAKYLGIAPDRQEVIQVTDEMLDRMTDDQLKRIAAGEALLTVLAEAAGARRSDAGESA